MKHAYTDNDILRFLYDEMHPTESEAFLDAIVEDEALWERYEYFQGAAEMAASLRYEPSEAAVRRVITYAHDTQPPRPRPSALQKVQTFLNDKVPLTLSLNGVMVMALILFVSVAILGSAFKLQRSLRQPPAGSLVQQVSPKTDPLMRWDDSQLEDQLQYIRSSMEDIREETVL